MSRTSGRSASRLAAILDALPDALLLADTSGTVVNANAVALELFEGESAERLLGKPVVLLLPGLGRAMAHMGPGPAALPAGSAPAGAVPSGAGRSRGPAERLAARRTDGTVFPAEVNTARLPDDGDELTLYVVRDLTGVLDVEAELRRQQRQIELILRAASEGIIGIDNESRIVLVNPAGARILRHRASDLGGQDVHELIAHSAADGTPMAADQVLIVDSLRTGAKHRSQDEVLWRSDGSAVTVDVTTAPVYEGDVIIGAVMTFADNGEARAATRRARELAEVLEDELHGPLAAVLTELRNVAEYGIGELGPNVRQALSSATSDLAELARLVDDIVDYQHMVVGDTPCDPRKIALSTVVDAAVQATDSDAAALGVDLVAHTADVEVMVDPQLFATMLAHLLADMINASPVGGKVVVTAARRGPVARIEIRGPHTGGGPLHLPIARAIVAQHGGTVTTHRIAGKGNTHVVEIPLEGPAGGGGKSAQRALAKGSGATGPAAGSSVAAANSRAVTVARIAPVSRVRVPSADHPQPGGAAAKVAVTSPDADPGAAAAGQVKQIEKTNGHHTSHGADARRPVAAAAPGQNGQARIPVQSRSSGSFPLDLKPSKPLPTSDVWSRPPRNPADPPTQEFRAIGSATAAAHSDQVAAANGGTQVTEPQEQRPWQPQAEAAPEEQPVQQPGSQNDDQTMHGQTTPGQQGQATQGQATHDQAAAHPVEETGQPRGRRRAAHSPDSPASAAPVPPQADARAARFDVTDDAPTQRMPPVVIGDARPAERTGGPAALRPVTAQVVSPQPVRGRPAAIEPGSTEAVAARPGTSISRAVDQRTADSGAVPGATASGTSAVNQEPTDYPTLLLWPEPDESTLELLDERGYEAVPLDNFDALARTLDELASQQAKRPSAVLVDPIAAPITRRGLRILRGAAVNASLPIMVTAGIGGGPAESPQGPDPALLLQALTPPAVSLPRVLLIEARDGLAEAMTDALERQGMQVLHAATDAESIDRASDGVPDVVLMDLMQLRRRRAGIVEWLRDHERLTTTPIVVYTALDTDSAQFATGLRSGTDALFLAERSTDAEAGNRIADLLAKICPA
ncbi:PAS domain-containing protein [Actinocrinis puniceicyclus]|uniref:PAS domain-containing protein n=1 Tax=Actinocrinis puniceicyclus TaxID=977794 RepID=A0A8J7WJ56_9ACTN|nr:PAS domain-containing protein [Actinocrinis puniceicyclus]MBS2963253.1 PAS domain-containing protein [Actinocrinis puniceicyclus]